jgi:glycosyltransferase involved in cell wall biosynthesis
VKVLHAIASLDERMGGSTRAALNLAQLQAACGDQTLVVASWDPEDADDYLKLEYSDVRWRGFRRRFPKHNYHAPGMLAWLRHHVGSFDVVELHGLFSFVPLYTYLACRATRTPYVVRSHGSLERRDLEKHAQAKRMYVPLVAKPMLRGAKAVIVASELEGSVLETFGVDVPRHVVPLPVRPLPAAGDGRGFRERYGIPPRATVVLFLGRFEHVKGLHLLIPALAALKAVYPDLHFLAAGSGTPAEVHGFERMLEGCGVRPWTTITGFLSGAEKRSALASSDIVSVPSLNESFGFVAVEAMQAGVAVAVSNEVGIASAIEKWGAGVVHRPSSDGVTEGIAALLSSADLRAGMAAHGADCVKREFDPVAIHGRLLDVYRGASNQAEVDGVRGLVIGGAK